MFVVSVFFFWVTFACLVGVYAKNKGRSGVGFFFLSLFLSPLIAFLIALLSSPDQQKVALRSNLKKCPACAEFIKGEARICRFCGFKFNSFGGADTSTKVEVEWHADGGEGGIWKVVRRDSAGKQIWISEGFHTKEEAEGCASRH